MKKILVSFINTPYIVIIASLAIAVAIGTFSFNKINSAPTYKYFKVVPGTISDLGTTQDSSSERHLTLAFLTTGRIQTVSVKVGDRVKKDQILATLNPDTTLGTLTQARAAYASAQANYNKLINGQTTENVAVSEQSITQAQSAVTNAKTNLDLRLQTEYTAIDNAIRSSIDPLYSNPNSSSPVFSVTINQAGSAPLVFQSSDSGTQIKLSNDRIQLGTLITELQTASDSTISKNYIRQMQAIVEDIFTVVNTIYNQNTNYDPQIAPSKAAVQSARTTLATSLNNIETAEQTFSSAQQNVTAAQEKYNVTVAPARSEDIASARAQMSGAYGSVQIAEAAYANRNLVAPGDGVVTAVYVTPGQIASFNTQAIDLSGNTFSKNVGMIIPNNSLIARDDKKYVLLKTAEGTAEKEITLGVQDAINSEVVSGLSVDDEIVTH